MGNETGKPAWTRGPWVIDRTVAGRPGGIRSRDIQANGRRATVVTFGGIARATTAEAEANAHLLRTAPELYEALAALEVDGLLESLIGLDEGTLDDGDKPIARPLVEQARKVLRLARGEAPAPEGNGDDA